MEKCIENIKVKKNEKKINFIYSRAKNFYPGNAREEKIENEENIKQGYDIMDIDEKFNELETPDDNINKFSLD